MNGTHRFFSYAFSMLVSSVAVCLAMFIATASHSSAQTWIQTGGPGVGNDVRVLAVGPSGEVYAGTWSSGGTVWKTTDNGSTWGQLATIPDSDPLLGMSVTASGHIIVSVFTKGMSVSTDGGQTWERRNTGITNYNLRQNLVDKSGAVWVASEAGIYRSTNEGIQWVLKQAGGFYQVLMDSAGAIVTQDGSNIYRSTDDGESWEKIPNATVGLGVTHPSGDYYGSNGLDGMMYRSTDHGATWTALTTPVTWRYGYGSTWASSRNGDLYTARDGAATGIMRSTDNGETWTVITEGLTTTRVIPLLCHPNGYVYAGTNGAGVFRTKEPLLTGTATLTLRTAGRVGQPPFTSPLRYRLTDSAHVSVKEVIAPPESAATFLTLLAGDRYEYTVRQTVAGPWRDLLLGRKGPLSIADHQVKSDTLVPSTPFITGVTMQIDSSGEALPVGGRHLVSPGTKIRVTVDVQNPLAAESVAVQVTAVCDRDTSGAHDLSTPSATVTIPAGATTTLTAIVQPVRAGEYYASVGLRSTAPDYVNTLTDGTVWLAPAFTLTPASGAAPWEVVNTGISHTIIIPTTAVITIAADNIAAGDFLGVFHDSAGVLACAGVERWTGESNLALAAFGDDPTTTAKDGFAAGEAIRWRICRAATGEIVRLRASYEPPSGIVTNTGTFAANGISRVAEMSGPGSEQCLTLRKGWGLISLNVLPPMTQLDTLFRDVLADLVILKNSKQKVFIPSVPVNSVGLWQPVEGYQVKFANARTLCVQGMQVDPVQVTVPLSAGWSYIPYLRETELPIASVLGGFSSDVAMVKDQDGKAYVPAVGVNAIGTMKPGQAYQIKMNAGRDLVYPIAAPGTSASDGAAAVKTVARTAVIPWTFTNTGTSHTVIIPLSAVGPARGLPLVAGDLVGFFYDSSGTEACAGFDTWTGTDPIGVAVFGDDPTTQVKDGFLVGETLKIKVWLTHSSTSYTPQPLFIPAGSLGGLVTDTTRFAPNGISALSALRGNFQGIGETSRPSSFSLDQNYPNPFNPSTVIPYALGTGTHVRLSVFSPLGQEMRVLVDQYQDAGEYRSTFDGSGLASGMYYYRLTAGQFTQTRKLILVR